MVGVTKKDAWETLLLRADVERLIGEVEDNNL
jgi:hypothetical protein